MWTITNREDAVEFIRNHIEAMQDGQYDWLYALIEPNYIGVPIFTKLLWSCDIHPELEGLTRIPEYYARSLDVKSAHLIGSKYRLSREMHNCCRGHTGRTCKESGFRNRTIP